MAARTVLVVDDDSSIRLICRINLQLDGFRVLEAATLEEARDALAEADAVLLDVHVGGGDGLAFVEEVRAARPDAGIALLTGTADLDGEHGADAVVGKPFTMDELRSTIERIGSDE